MLFNAVPLIWYKVGDVTLDINERQALVDKPSALTDRHMCAALHLIYVLQIDSLDACFTMGAGSADSAKYKQ